MFDRLSTRIFAALAATGLLVSAFLFGFGVGRNSDTAPSSDVENVIREAQQAIAGSAMGKVDQTALIQAAVRGMLDALEDPYAEYLDHKTYVSFSEFTEGEFAGVGLWLKHEETLTKVVTVLEGTPAAKAGIAEGDVIVAVDGERVAEWSLEKVAQSIKGEVGTEVVVVVSRQGRHLEFALTREAIEFPSVELEMLAGGVGHIKVVSFIGGSGEKVADAVAALEAQGVRGYVLDLRGNPGGLVSEAIKAAGVFLGDRVVVSYREREREPQEWRSTVEQKTTKPLAVLVDEGSASAAEIVAGALKDHKRAILVGSATYGKGSVQRVFPLTDGSALKLTVANYHLPSGASIGQRGIHPDIALAPGTDHLARAREIIVEMLAEAPRRAS